MSLAGLSCLWKRVQWKYLSQQWQGLQNPLFWVRKGGVYSVPETAVRSKKVMKKVGDSFNLFIGNLNLLSFKNMGSLNRLVT